MKKPKIKRTLSLALSLSVLVSVIAVPVQVSAAEESPPDWKSGIVDHWSFDTFQSDAGKQSTAIPYDVALTDTQNPIFGQALHFDAGTDQYLKLADYINTGSGKTSFSMWYYYDTTIPGDEAEQSAVLLQHEDKESFIGRSLLTLKPDNHYHTFLNGENVSSSGTFQRDRWEHITITFDQDTQKVSFYINGKLDSQSDLGNTPENSQTLSLRIGAHKDSGNTNPHPMRGYIDEFYVYHRALTSEEARALYADKGTAVLASELQELITQANKLYESNALPQDSAPANRLKEQLEQAQAAHTIDELETAYEALNEAIQAYQSNSPIVLTIAPLEVSRVIEPDSIFGINHRYAFNGYGTFDSERMRMKDDFTALYRNAGFGSIRYPGGTISNLFNWKTTIGPKKDRKKQIHGFYNNDGQGGIEPNFGLTEIAEFASDVNSEIVYVYSLGRGNAQDASDLIEYLNAQVGTNPNDGIDWAQVRADNGHPEPYNVRYFEIGNEMQQASNADGTASQGYWTTYGIEGGHVNAYTNGGTARFTKTYAVAEEDWNKKASQSDGSPNLVRYMRYANLNPGMMVDGKIVPDPSFQAVNDDIEVYVGNDQSHEQWEIVSDLRGSSATDTHCIVDKSTGAIQFGDGTNGKIPDAGSNIYVTYSVNRQGFLDISKAIKNTTAKINEIEGTSHQAKVYTSHESKEFIDLMEKQGDNEWYDGMTIHPYSGSVQNVDDENAFYDEAMQKAEEVGIGNVQKYVKMLPKDKVPVISEYGIFKNTQPQVRSQTHALYIAKVLMEYVKLGSPYIQKHCLSDWYIPEADALGPTQQAVIQVVPKEGASTQTGEGEFEFFATPSAHVFQMLNAGFGKNIIKAEFDKIPQMHNGVKTLSALASRDDEGNIYLALVNIDRENDQTIALQFEHFNPSGCPVEIQRLESEHITDENTLQEPDKISVQTESWIGNPKPLITLKKHSFAVIKITNEISSSPAPHPTPTPEEKPDKPEQKPKPAPKPEPALEPEIKPEVTISFSDVSPSAWYQEAVQFAVRRNLFQGISEHTFAPDMPMTRGMLVTVLHRLAGMPHVNSAAPFTDSSGEYYTDAVNWAVSAGIVSGMTPNSFSPHTQITREQLATILYRYAIQKQYQVSESQTLTGFLDAAQISPFAQEAMQWANAVQLIHGSSNQNLNPKSNATRAEVAAILMRFCSKYSA